MFPTVKSGEKGIMVWGVLQKKILGPLIVVDRTITANIYKKVVGGVFAGLYGKS